MILIIETAILKSLFNWDTLLTEIINAAKNRCI